MNIVFFSLVRSPNTVHRKSGNGGVEPFIYQKASLMIRSQDLSDTSNFETSFLLGG